MRMDRGSQATVAMEYEEANIYEVKMHEGQAGREEARASRVLEGAHCGKLKWWAQRELESKPAATKRFSFES